MCLIVTHRGSSDDCLVKDSIYVVTVRLEVFEDGNTEAEIMMMLEESPVWSMETVITAPRLLRAATTN